MKISALAPFRVVLGFLAVTFGVLTMSGCAGGWGEYKPTIVIQQGQSQTVISGQTATFKVTASGTGPFSYQWYLNGVAIGGATSSSFTTGATVGSQNGSIFTVAVTNAGGTIMSAPYVLTVNTPPAITVQPASQTVFVGQAATFAVTATGTAPLTYQWYLGGLAIDGATANSYTTPVTMILGDSSVYSVIVNNVAGTATSAMASLTVAPMVPTLAFTPIAAQTYGAAAFPVSATSASSGAVTYSVVSGPATISGSTVTLTGIGTVVLQANQIANGNYTAAATTTSFSVAAETPTLAFTPIAAQTYGAAAFSVSATSASSGAVTYSVVSGPAAISGSTVTLTGIGTVVLQAHQIANGNYTAATTTTSFTVAAEAPTLTFTPIAAQTYGAAALPVSATSASSGAVTYSVVSGPATVSGSTLTLTGIGTVVLQAHQIANGNYTAATTTTSFTVAAETPTLAFTSIAAQTYGAAAFPVSATSASSGAVTYSVVSGPATISGSTVTLTGIGTVVLQAHQIANGNYTAATTTTSFSVAAEAPTLTFTSIAAQTYGAAAFPVSATSASSGEVTYSVVSGPATISGSTLTLTGIGTVVLQAHQIANGNYTAATTTTSFSVAAEAPTLAFTPIAAQTYGAAAFPVSATSASSGAVTYSVVSGPATISGSTVTLTGIGTVVLQANQIANGNYTAATATTSFSVTANVTITPITPANQSMAPGQQTFSAIASGGPTNSLTWTATGGTITSSGVWTSPDIAGTYTIRATSVDEPSAYVTTTAILNNPVITAQPVSKNVCAGYSPSFTIGASYATNYAWYKNGSPVGSNSSALTFNDVSNTSNGNYSCTVSNGAGSVTSNTVLLNVLTPTTLSITSQPASVSVYATQTATFAVSASGTGTLSYQWYRGTPGSGTVIPGATASTYTTGTLAVANNGSTYYATVTDADCTATTLTSTAATLTVTGTDTAVPPTIITQPTGQTADVDGTATFSVTASGSGTLTYQWYRAAFSSTELTTPTAGVSISGANSRTYTVPSRDTAQNNDGDNYYVVVTNAYGSAVSNRVVLAVGDGILLQITGQPQTDYVPASSLASFSVTANCTGCIPAYQWYWAAPGSTTFNALSNGAVSSGTLNGATVAGATTSSLTLNSVPTTASGGVFYVIVTSTSDGVNQVSGTHPLTSSTAGLFVGSLGTIGNPTTGEGLCNSSSVHWVLNGTTGGSFSAGTVSGDVPYQNTSACTIEMTNDQGTEAAAVYWPTLISTAKFSVSFTVAISAGSSPADGFTMILANPSQGATTASIGRTGEGLGADGIPGFVLGFDTYQNGNAYGGPLQNTCSQYTGDTTNMACDPITVPYMAVGQGATNLWENPWTNVNGNLDTQNSTDYSDSIFTNATHAYVVTVNKSIMTVTMDGYELFTGTVSLPPVAYLGFTASTGGSMEAVTISALTATVSAP